MSERRWQAGDTVVLRHVETPLSARIVHAYMGDPALARGIPFLVNHRMVTVMARAYRVVADSDDAIILFQPPDTRLMRWQIDEQRYLPAPQSASGSSLRFLYPGTPYDVTLFFEGAGEVPWYYDAFFADEGMTPGWRERRRAAGDSESRPRQGSDGLFRGWYINLQSPPRRTAYGIDITDLALDIVVRPDYSWYWKDEDELQMALDQGACTSDFADRLRRAGEGVVELIENRASPFDDAWTSWRPPADWAITDIPDGWQTAPALVEQWWEMP
jgi:hypothetical protein